MKVVFRLLLGVMSLLVLISGYLFFCQKVLWLSENNAKIKPVSGIDTRNYYKEISNKKLSFLLIRYDNVPKNTQEENRIFSIDNKKLFWNCYWRRIQIFGILTPLWEMGIYFDVEKMVNNNDIETANLIINRNISSCLTNFERFKSEKMSTDQLLELDMQNYEKMKSYNNGQIFELIYTK